MTCPNFKICYNSDYAEDGNTKIENHTDEPSKAFYRCRFCDSIHITRVFEVEHMGTEQTDAYFQCLECKLLFELYDRRGK